MPRRITPRCCAIGPHAYTPNVRLRLEMGRYVLAEDYVRALRGRAVIAREIERALEGVDALDPAGARDRGAADRRGHSAGEGRHASRCAT